MGAEYLSYVKSIATFAPTFYGYINSVLASVFSAYCLILTHNSQSESLRAGKTQVFDLKLQMGSPFLHQTRFVNLIAPQRFRYKAVFA